METVVDIEKQEMPVVPVAKASFSPDSHTTSIPTKPPSFHLAWKDVSYSVDTPNGKKAILQNINGWVEKGPRSLNVD